MQHNGKFWLLKQKRSNTVWRFQPETTLQNLKTSASLK